MLLDNKKADAFEGIRLIFLKNVTLDIFI